MLVDLHIPPLYDGFLFLAESVRNPPKLMSHRHIELELNLVLRGTITYVVGNQRFRFAQGTLLWMFPSQDHQLVDRTDDAQYYVAVFKPYLIERSCRGEAYQELKQYRHTHDAVLHTRLEPETFDFVRRTMDSLMQGSLDPDLLNREVGFGIGADFCYHHDDPDGLNAGLHHLLLLCWRCQRTGQAWSKAVSLHPAVRKTLAILSDEKWEGSLGKLATKCGVSEAYLSRVFRLQIGVPLSRYRNSLRMARFWDHYRGADQRTVTESVYAAGFGSYAQFFKIFTQTYGQGPRARLLDLSG